MNSSNTDPDSITDGPQPRTSKAAGQFKKWRMPQVGISSLLLATACIAVWYGTWLNGRRIHEVLNQLHAHELVSRVLVLKDRDHLSIIRQLTHFSEGNRWHVFVPGDGYKLNLALLGNKEMDVNSSSLNSSTALLSQPLLAGMHEIEFNIDPAVGSINPRDWQLIVRLDSGEIARVTPPPQWNLERGTLGGGYFARQVDIAKSEDAILFMQVFAKKNDGDKIVQADQSADGIRLWIESP